MDVNKGGGEIIGDFEILRFWLLDGAVLNDCNER